MAVLWIFGALYFGEQKFDDTPIFWLLLRKTCTKTRDFAASYAALPVRSLGVQEEQEEDTTRTAAPD